MVTRFDPTDPETESTIAESEKLIRAFCERHPHIARKMMPSANEVKRMLKQHGIAPAPGKAYGEFPVVKVPPELAESVEAVSRKLTLALHYFHTSRIVPTSAEVHVFWWTNAQHLTGKFPSDAFRIIRGQPSLRRGAVTLSDQFNYRYEVSGDGTLGAYLAAFRSAIIVAGFIVIGRAEKLLDDTRLAREAADAASGGNPGAQAPSGK